LLIKNNKGIPGRIPLLRGVRGVFFSEVTHPAVTLSNTPLFKKGVFVAINFAISIFVIPINRKTT